MQYIQRKGLGHGSANLAIQSFQRNTFQILGKRINIEVENVTKKKNRIYQTNKFKSVQPSYHL
eukprot:m.76600 g.76600  ORF g.76600 m.76600 type:complete len:63 (+) comp12567_c0_seq3:595-783(+)